MIPVRLLDLFSGAGGAAMGYAQAGFVVTGVDHKPQPHYPFKFIQGDVFEILDRIDLTQFDAIHASPPCQRYTRNARQRGTADSHPDLIAPIRARLDAIGKPYIIENVELAPLINPVLLCGTMFGLGVFRHRNFEMNWNAGLAPVHPDHDGRIGDGRYFTVAGHTGFNSTRDGRIGGTADDWRRAMDVKWMSCYELAEAIPPAYTRHLGDLLMGHVLRLRARSSTRHVVMFSSGAGSAIAAYRVVNRFGAENVTLLFADVNGEHPDNYRFMKETAAWLGADLVWLHNDGQTIWDVFKKVRFLGNTRIDPCSRVLKREPMRRWLEENCDPADTVAYLGFDWTEEHRHRRAEGYWAPWRMESPLIWDPPLDKSQALDILSNAGIEPPLLTRQGFPHANCGGGCIKAGIGQFKKLLEIAPETYRLWEDQEEELRVMLGDIAILRDRTGGTTKPLTLRALRHRLEVNPRAHSGEDWGACNCLTPLEPEGESDEEAQAQAVDPALVTIRGRG